MVAACSTARLNAQGYAKIIGTVTDPSGAVVPSATVTATQTQTGVESVVKSGGDGAFVFPALLPSTYTVSVSAKGFRNYTQTGIALEANAALTVNFKLVVGSSAETVSVIGDAPQVDTSTGTLSQVIDESSVVDLPLNGRNAANLITLVAGVVVAPGNGLDQGSTKTFPGQPTVTANGTLPNQSSYMLNGGNNTDEMTNITAPFPFPDALQEFSVQTSNYNAEYGQSAGAVVNIVSKSGGQKFHGDAFEYLRNGYFNARPYFATVADNIHRHQYGGVIGGPVIIPFVSKGKSTQFFFGYQHTLLHSLSGANTSTVPTLANMALTPTGTALGYADLSNKCTGGWNSSNFCNTASQQVVNPFTGVSYPLNHIAAADFDPSSLNFLKGIPSYSGTPAAGKIGGTVNWTRPTIQAWNEYVSRVDHSFGDKDHLFGHYYYNFFDQKGVYNPAMLLSYSGYSNVRYQNALLAETHTFSNNLLNNLIINYQREFSARGGPAGGADVIDAPKSTTYPGAPGGGMGVNNVWQPGVDHIFSSISVSGYFGASASAYAGWMRNNYTFNDDIHWVVGKHNMAFGGHYELSKFDVTNVYQSFGSFGFNTGGAGTVDAYANFMVGFMGGTNAFQQGNFEQVNDRAHFPGIYAQDSWKVNPHLTVNYGVRWEQFAPWANRNGNLQEFVPANYVANTHTAQFSAASLPAGTMLSGDAGIAPNGVYNKNLQFMPRVGFAYDVKGDGKLVVRGGGGVFFQDRIPGFFNLNQASLMPNTISVTTSSTNATAGNPGGPFSNPYCNRIGGVYVAPCSAAGEITNPFPFTLPFPATKIFPWKGIGMQVFEFDPSGNFRVPVTYDFNLTVEQQLASSLAMRIAYVGSMSRHQFVNLDLNPSVNTGAFVNGAWVKSALGTNQRRPYNTAPVVGPCTSATGCDAGYQQIVVASMTGSGGYNSLQVTLDKKMSHGVSFLANYTWSKSLDNLPYSVKVGNTEDINVGESYVYPQFPAGASNMPAGSYVTNIQALDHGISDLDHRSVISVSYGYQLPKLRNGNRVLKYAANGWRTNGLVQRHTGDALTVYAGTDSSATGLAQERGQRNYSVAPYTANWQTDLGNCAAGTQCHNWFTTGAFSTPLNTGPGTGFGNVVKGSTFGPAVTNWDGSVARTFSVYRESNLEFKAEYFDVLNHTILGNPNITTSNAAFGTIKGTQGGPRIAQFALKFIF